MKVIYEPRGRAREYAPLAANLFTGCTNGCLYCYAPACLRRSRESFHEGVTLRKNVLGQLEKDAAKLSHGAGPVLLCFSCDPYPNAALSRHTLEAIKILGEAGVVISILTKNPTYAQSHFAVLKEYDVRKGNQRFLSSEQSQTNTRH